MITVTDIRNVNDAAYDEVWAIVRSLKNPRKMKHVPELSPSWVLFKKYMQLRDAKQWNADSFEITEGIREVKASRGERFTVKQLEKTKKSLEARLEKLQANDRKDDVVTFEELGVDMMFVDESDLYKNLFLYTKMRNVAGLSTADAQKSSDMFAKCRYLDETTGGRGIAFATGTPISNSMTEMYSIQRYLQYDRLQEMGMPAYFFYDYKRREEDIPGVCSSCGNEIRLSGVKQGKKAICPLCKKELNMKPRSHRGCCMTDRDTCQVIQNVGNGELIIRIIKVYYTYTDDTPGIKIYENARRFIYVDSDGKIHCEDYYYSYGSGILTDWKKGERPAYYKWQYHFAADTWGHLYDKNLPAALKNTPWQYCPIAEFYNHYHEPVQSLPFLAAYLKHPRLEHLVKTGFCSIVSDMVYSYSPDCLDESQSRTHRILKVSAEDVQFLWELNADMDTLKIFQEYAGLKDRQKLLLWQMEHEVSRDILPILKYMTVHKFIRYMDRQYSFLRLRRTPHGSLRYKKMQDLISEYRDYLEICRKMNYDMKNSFVLYPTDLQKSHDKTAHRFKQKKDALMKQKFTAVYQQLLGKFDFEKSGLKIVYPNTPDDLIAEGHALHHCVGGYGERVADKECIILFLRKCSDESKPFYTIEVRGQKVIQVRGMSNRDMTPEVRDFIKNWERSVLCTRLPAAAA